MKAIAILFLLSSQSFAADYSYFENLLQSKLGFSGEVKVTRVNSQDNGDIVIHEVTSYGETRQNWCLIDQGEVVQCMDNWYYNVENDFRSGHSEADII